MRSARPPWPPDELLLGLASGVLAAASSVRRPSCRSHRKSSNTAIMSPRARPADCRGCTKRVSCCASAAASYSLTRARSLLKKEVSSVWDRCSRWVSSSSCCVRALWCAPLAVSTSSIRCCSSDSSDAESLFAASAMGVKLCPLWASELTQDMQMDVSHVTQKRQRCSSKCCRQERT